MRKHWLAHGSITTSDIEPSWPIKKDLPGYKFNLDYNDLKRNMLRLRHKLQERGILPRDTLTVTFTGLDGRKI